MQAKLSFIASSSGKQTLAEQTSVNIARIRSITASFHRESRMRFQVHVTDRDLNHAPKPISPPNVIRQPPSKCKACES
ncbi:hypothetical protein RSSM_03644 [Rhodopirellula sallentina SM41]|uniref:Uncharacterized protein n=1 Tax=Rhodopirellula sallentina SM41 TaxID=1263870 RepID=M5U0D0_9BACT|nr:hypothetical protein RSSM_03644 [Rhodopirellula sallentina SM41]